MELGLEKNKEKTIEAIKNDLKQDKSKHPFHDDLLNLKGIAETLSNIISNTKDPFVYSINSPYGTGKTFFLRRLHCLLEQKQCLVVSYNAWESDFYSDPLSALIGELANQIDSKKFEKTEQEVAVLTNASIGFSFGLTGNFNFGKKKNISETYQQHKDRKENFIKTLREFTKELPSPLVFIIDELDRCRPDYAIQTLEIIKHFFNIPKITFIIGVDRKQIESTVRVLYGSNVDTCCDEYLRKFIDQDFYLPKPSSTIYIRTLCRKYLASVILPFGNRKNFFSIYNYTLFSNIFTNKDSIVSTGDAYEKAIAPIKEQFINTTIELITAYVDALSEYFVFSLRKQEQFIISLKILFSLLSSKDDILLPELGCLLTAIKLYDYSILHKPKTNFFDIFSYETSSNLKTPELVKLINKSEGVLNKYKLSTIKTETMDNESKLNAIQKWQIYLNDDIPRDKQLSTVVKKYLHLTKQLSLLENQQ